MIAGALSILRPRRRARLGTLALAAALPAACAAPRPPPASVNPFAGAWTTAERQQIAFRSDTVVISPSDAPPTPMSAATCDGAFRFGYGHETGGALIGLAPRQPDLQRRLAGLLTRPDYPVAVLECGEGGTVYVMLDQRDLLAIHHAREVAGIERLSRP